MVSVIGLDSDKVAALCNAANEEVSEDEKVQIANFVCPVSWPIYLFCCFSFTSGVVIGGVVDPHICQGMPMVLLCEEHCSLAASMNPVSTFFYSGHPATEMQPKGDVDDLVTITICQGNYTYRMHVKGMMAFPLLELRLQMQMKLSQVHIRVI
jgi:hypothetical protein